MYRYSLTTAARRWILFGPLFIAGLASPAPSAEPSDVKAAIERLGGSVRPFGGDHEELEVEFHLRGRKLTDEGLASVAPLKNVVSLNLRSTKITSGGLVHLKGLAKLRRLHLERTEVGDEGIEHLLGLVDLEYLNLYATRITDKSLERLAGLRKLKRLYLWQTDVTDKGVARLEKALPELKIVRGVDLSKLPASFPSETEKPKPTATLKWVAVSSREEAPARSQNGLNTQVFFENKSGRRVKLYWIAYGGELKLYAELALGGTRWQNTYSNNAWLITNANDKPLGYFLVKADESLAVIPSQKSRE